MTICGPNQTLTKDQVAQFMRNAGFPESVIPVGLAVSYAESGWQTGNCNLADANGGSFGLWQINGIHFGNTSKDCAFDPQCATNYAHMLWTGQGWNPWGAFTDGRYLSYLNGATPPSGSGAPSGTSSTSITPPDPMSPQAILNTLIGTGKAFDNLYQWMSDPVRIIKMVVGVLLTGIAVAVMFIPMPDKIGSTISAFRKASHPIKATQNAIAKATYVKPKPEPKQAKQPSQAKSTSQAKTPSQPKHPQVIVTKVKP